MLKNHLGNNSSKPIFTKMTRVEIEWTQEIEKRKHQNEEISQCISVLCLNFK